MSNLNEAMAECLALMEAAGLKLYGRKLGKAMVTAYVAVCESRGYEDPELLRRAAISFCQEDGEFPTASQFAGRCRQVWESDHIQIGLPAAAGDALRIAWVPVRDYQALPRGGGGVVPEAEVAALMARLDSLGGRRG